MRATVSYTSLFSALPLISQQSPKLVRVVDASAWDNVNRSWVPRQLMHSSSKRIGLHQNEVTNACCCALLRHHLTLALLRAARLWRF